MSGTTIFKSFLFYAGHVLAGTAGAILPVFLVFLPATMSPPLFELVTPVLGIIGEPFFPVDILLGFSLGWYLNRRVGHGLARWVWILPTICLVYTIATWDGHLYSRRSYWADVRHELFGSGSSSTERVYQFFVTLPFYTSVAYSIGAHFGYRRWRARNSEKPAPQTAGA